MAIGRRDLRALCCILCMTALTAWGAPQPAPPNSTYAEPNERLSASDVGWLHFPSYVAGDFKGVIQAPERLLSVAGIGYAQLQPGAAAPETLLPIAGMGYLTLPSGASIENKAPAVVILHGSGGLSMERARFYADHFLKYGLASFVVDYYTPRGVRADTPYMERITLVSEAEPVVDAYGALRLLGRHPLIDAERIVLLGLSYGGMAARSALDARIYARLSGGARPYALHINLYGPCYYDIGTKETTGVPFLSFDGEADLSHNHLQCARLNDSLRAAGSSVGTITYPEVGHAWEKGAVAHRAEALNTAGCDLRLDDSGNWIIAGELWSVQATRDREAQIEARRRLLGKAMTSCVRPGYAFGGTQVHREKVLDDLVDYFKWFRLIR